MPTVVMLVNNPITAIRQISITGPAPAPDPYGGGQQPNWNNTSNKEHNSNGRYVLKCVGIKCSMIPGGLRDDGLPLEPTLNRIVIRSVSNISKCLDWNNQINSRMLKLKITLGILLTVYWGFIFTATANLI